MGSFRIPFNAVFIIICFTSVTSAIGANETDRLALLEFKKMITDDPFGVMLSWNASTHFCQWHGVTCSPRHQRVAVLDLQSSKLTGSLSPHIGNLSFLRRLSLQNNSFSHEIPSEIGYLHRLQALELYNNSIGGSIPTNISACINLVTLYVSINNLVGEIPWELGRLRKLENLILYDNNLTGNIPPSLGNLSSLVLLSIGFNSFFGSIPSSLGRLKNLTFLSVFDDKLKGLIPPSIFNLSYITTLEVGHNQFEGNLPSDIGITLPNLQVLSTSENDFTGNFPVSISNASKLEDLQVNSNKFTGEMPSLDKLRRLIWFNIAQNLLGTGRATNDLSFLCSLTNATNLELLYMQRNNFGGTLPECMSNITASLTGLGLGENQIYGRIPVGIGNLINLERLGMWENQLSGQVPPSIGRLHKLQILDLNQNKLEGNIPSSLGNLSLMSDCYLNQNNLHGSLPSSLGNCTDLLTFNVFQNKLGGAIPPELMRLSALISFNLSNNNFTGALPSEIGDLKNLGVLDVSENKLSGMIPSGLGGCVSLERLHMQGNFFEGQIPPSLSSLRGLQVIDFSRNNFSGEIPKFLASFDLKNVNLSYNNFEGAVPMEGIFANTVATSVVGNTKLCGGMPEFHLPACNSQASKKKRRSFNLKLSLFIVLVILVIFVSSLLFWIQFKKKTKKLDSRDSVKSFFNVSYQYLLKATGGFSSANLIGVGSFGSVYKGILDNGTMIAVKVFNSLHQGGFKSFIAECEALRNVRHRNLVKILTICSGFDHHGNDFKAVVYEFMVNGSLEEWLHPLPDAINEMNWLPRSLNLLQRLNIAIDIASALEYLHHQCETVVVHCDLKPSNVLLDDEMTARVGDFGLAKLLSDDIQSSTNPSSSLALRGTIGYAPPEYGIGSEVSTSGDVYSYGILLLEMFTGTKPTNDIFVAEGFNLNTFVKAALPERVLEIVDPLLLKEMHSKHNASSMRKNSTALECSISVLRVGIACSVESPRDRMNISEVAVELHSIRNKLLQTQSSHQNPN